MGVADDEIGERLVQALTQLEEVADALTPDDALTALDEASLQIFWKDWPNVSSWAGALWRRLDADMARASTPPQDEFDDVGGEGG